ncbi:MAG: rhomboid family intramembrane serine protease [Planctomycetota bacterium]|nr:MAG: rhomboid family intramembrane serine protease [Planctomycetota bacterium]
MLLFFVLPIEAWLLVVLLIGLDLLNFLSATGGGVSQLAHLGGAAFGYIFVRHRDRFDRWIDRFSARLEARRAAQAEESEARLDALLDKINREGIGSLTPRERAFLKRASRRYQDRGGR